MKPRNERQAHELRNEIHKLGKELAESQSDLERVDAELGETPLLRDRSKFFHGLLNSDLVVYERKAPLWRERKRCARRVRRFKRLVAARRAKIETVVQRGVEDEAEHRRLREKLAREEEAGRSCTRMLESITEARRRIDHALRLRPRDEAARLAMDQAATKVAEQLRVVRKRAADVSANVAPHASFDIRDITKLDIKLARGSAEPRVWVRQYKGAKDQLASVEKTVRSLLPGIKARKGAIEREMRHYVTEAIARFQTDPPPS